MSYLFIVCLVFPDEFIEMGIINVLILSILFVILYPVFLQAWQKAHKRHVPHTQQTSGVGKKTPPEKFR